MIARQCEMKREIATDSFGGFLMASIAQIQANRSNAQKSTGPRTPQGKATASQNAVKHGLLAEQVVIHGEDPAEFDLYREGMLAELAPERAVEAMLAERAVSLAWRLRRAERLQNAVFATVYRENANDVVLWPKHGLPIQPGPGEDEVVLGQVVMTDFARAQVLDRLLVYERRIESSLYRTMAQLRRERETRTTAGPEGVPHSEPGPGGEPRRVATEVTEGHREERAGEGKNAAIWEPLVCSPGRPPGSVPSVGSVAKTLISASDRPGGLPAGQAAVAGAELASFGAEPVAGEVSSVKCQVSSGGSDFPLQTSHLELPKITPYGVTTNGEEPAAQPGVETLHDSPFTLHDSFHETNPILGGVSSRARHSAKAGIHGESGAF
jgi:hypothetical protein